MFCFWVVYPLQPCQINAENIETAKKISMLEEDMKTDTESERIESEAENILYIDGLFSCEYCKTQFGIKKYFEAHMRSHKGGEYSIECLEWKFNSTSKNIFQKQLNMKHPRVMKNLSVTNPDENKENTELEDNDNSEDSNKEESSSEEDDPLCQYLLAIYAIQALTI